MEGLHQCWQVDGELDVFSQPTQVLERVRHALQKMRLALVKSPETVGAQRLHYAYVDVRIIVLHERVALDVYETAEAVEIVIEQFLAQLGWQISLAIIEQRRNVVMQRAFAAALVVK